MPPRSRSVLLLFLALLAIALGLLVWWRAARRLEWTDPATPPPPLAAAIAAFRDGQTDRGVAEVERYLATYSAPAWEVRARLLAAVHLLAAGRAEPALDLLPRDPRSSEPLAPWLSLLGARALLAAGRPGDAAEASARASEEAKFPDREEAVRLLSRALEAAGDAPRALAVLDAEGAGAFPIEAARVAVRLGDLDGARRRLVRLALAAPAGEDAERAMDHLFALVPDPMRRFDEEDRKAVVEAALRWKEAGRTLAAWRLLKGARPPDAPPSSLPPSEALARAEILLLLGRLPDIPGLLARASEVGGEAADAAHYLTARTHLARGARARYRRALESLAGRRPASSWILRAQHDLAQMADGRPSRAAWLAYRVYRASAGPRADPTALWREAWIAYELGLRREADEGMERVLARRDAPDSVRLAALYWKGRRLEAAGHREAARACWREIVEGFPNHHYGALSEKRLALPAPATPDEDVGAARLSPSLPAHRWLEAARAFSSVGLREEAWRAYGAAVGAADGADRRAVGLEAAGVALDQGATSEAIRFVRTAVGDKDGARLEDLPLRYWRVLVPAPEGDGLVRAAREAGLDPLLVGAVALEESSFNPLAVSGAGAKGILQLMPETAAEVARRIGLRGFRPEQLYEPETNLKLGCAYLKALLARYGSLPAALAAYNAGPARATAWTTTEDRRDGERFVERIPIADTRRYVKRILADLRLYRIVWKEGFPGAPS